MYEMVYEVENCINNLRLNRHKKMYNIDCLSSFHRHNSYESVGSLRNLTKNWNAEKHSLFYEKLMIQPVVYLYSFLCFKHWIFNEYDRKYINAFISMNT